MAVEVEKFIKEKISELSADHPDRDFLSGILKITTSYLLKGEQPIMEERWLTQKEAADYLKVHPKTIYRYTKSGLLPQHGVGRPRFLREELDNLLKQS